ncbi:MAG: type II toxin-antitoxin system VapC family toxin [Acidimicrobiales bacterium]
MTEIGSGLIDTSVVIDRDVVAPERLPAEAGISAVTLAELSAGPHATDDPAERSRRQSRLEWASSTFDPYPFDGDAARAYGQAVAAVRAAGRRERSRVADLLIAATAASLGLPLFTRNPDDFVGLEQLVDVRPV